MRTKWKWKCPDCGVTGLKLLSNGKARKNGRIHRKNYHGINEDPIVTKVII